MVILVIPVQTCHPLLFRRNRHAFPQEFADFTLAGIENTFSWRFQVISFCVSTFCFDFIHSFRFLVRKFKFLTAC